MKLSPSRFWTWFRGFAERVPDDDVPGSLQDELLTQLQCVDPRLYFLLSINASPKEFIVTADGDTAAFPAADDLVGVAPEINGWSFLSLKPALGFRFRHSDGPISIDASELWFIPAKSEAHPAELGIILGFPDADLVLANQSVDTAYTILETGIGERKCAADIAHVAVDDLPDDPSASGYLEISHLSDYISFHKRRHNSG